MDKGASFGPGSRPSDRAGQAVSAVPASIPRAGSVAYVQGQTVDHDNREANDFYPTHAGATLALLSAERFEGAIWEPACGEGDITRVLGEAGHEVVSSDLIDRGFGETGIDFLMEWQARAPNIITNPPFKLASEFIDKALSLTTGKVAMFLRLAFLEGVGRSEAYARQPLARVWVMSRRVPMWRGEVRDEIGSMMAMAWFVWDHGHKGSPTLGWLDWKAAMPAPETKKAAAAEAPHAGQGSLFGEAA